MTASRDLPNAVKSKLRAIAAEVMPRDKSGAFLPLEGQAIRWRDWVVTEARSWCIQNGFADISADSLSHSVTL